ILEAGRLKQESRGRRLVVAGCLAQRYGEELRGQLSGVDIFVGTGNFLDLPDLLRRAGDAEARSGALPGAGPLLPSSSAPRVKTGDFFSAYLKISEGCDHKCAFCIIPKIRGRHESRVMEDVVAEARGLVESGVREINLIAQDLTAYGRDLRPRSSL